MSNTDAHLLDEVLAHAVVASAYATALSEQLDRAATPAAADRAGMVSAHVHAIVCLTQRLRGTVSVPDSFILTPTLPSDRLCAE